MVRANRYRAIASIPSAVRGNTGDLPGRQYTGNRQDPGGANGCPTTADGSEAITHRPAPASSAKNIGEDGLQEVRSLHRVPLQNRVPVLVEGDPQTGGLGRILPPHRTLGRAEELLARARVNQLLRRRTLRAEGHCHPQLRLRVRVRQGGNLRRTRLFLQDRVTPGKKRDLALSFLSCS